MLACAIAKVLAGKIAQSIYSNGSGSRDVEGREGRDSHEGRAEGRGGCCVELVVAARCDPWHQVCSGTIRPEQGVLHGEWAPEPKGRSVSDLRLRNHCWLSLPTTRKVEAG